MENQINLEIKEKIALGVKGEVVDIFEDILKTIWERIAPTLGVITVVTILQRAAYRTAQEFPIIKHLSFTEEGIDFTELKSRAMEEDKELIKEIFREFIGNLFDILAKLTGNVLVGDLMKIVEGNI
ncbi:MAG: hypothetical protein H8D67_06060 [Deltaproteobacteria bacterium]|nr:hypothetical protein [Deltaproteobacteria bacterium]